MPDPATKAVYEYLTEENPTAGAVVEGIQSVGGLALLTMDVRALLSGRSPGQRLSLRGAGEGAANGGGAAAGALSTSGPRLLPPPRPLAMGEGDVISHFTDAKGVEGVTGIVGNRLSVGQQVIVRELRFGVGSNEFLAGEKGRIFVTKLGDEATVGELNQIGVFGEKQSFVVQFSGEAAFTQGARVTPELAARNIYSIPGNSTLKEYDFIVKRLR